MAEELNDQERRETELWQVLDWSLWGNGLGDVLRFAMADVMVSALSDEQREQAEACIKAWHARRGPSMAVGEGTELAKRVAYLDARVGELNNTIGELRASIADIDAHAIPVGLLHNDDPEGSPHHYLLTVGALHRALGKAYTAEPCESERARLRVEVDRLRREVEFEANAVDWPWNPRGICACSIDFASLDPDRWVRPQCAVHPETRGEGEERSGRDDTGQASGEEA